MRSDGTDTPSAIAPPAADSLTALSAVDLAARLQARDISAREVMASYLDRIDDVNPAINAIVTRRDRDQLMVEAAAADDAGPSGPLHGFPLAVKDLSSVAGLPTSAGSKMTPTAPAAADTLFVSRLREAGAIFIGKTNTPEFGVGSHTFNEVFGITRNPANLTRSSGGSSGGAGAALAAHLLPVADGSDLGGSLRNPGAFNGVVGFRPSIGRVPQVSPYSGFIATLAVTGPMARTVADCALMLSVMAGPHAADPLSLPEPGSTFAPPLAPLTDTDLSSLRMAWAGPLGLDWEPEAYSVPHASMERFTRLGASIEDAAPDLTGSMQTFRTLRALLYRNLSNQFPEEVWRQMKDPVIEEITSGLALSVDEVMAAETNRTRIHHEMAAFFERFDILALPTTQVAPFSAEIGYPEAVNGATMSGYIEWMSSCCIITTTGCPSISVPCGTTSDGLPLGLQLVAPVGGEQRLLRIAAAFESAA